MKAKDALIAWNPAHLTDKARSTDVAVGTLLEMGQRDWTAPYLLTGGAAEVSWRQMEGDLMRARLFIEFHTLVVRDGIDPMAAHEAFMAIDEYRASISPDTTPDLEQRRRDLGDIVD